MNTRTYTLALLAALAAGVSPISRAEDPQSGIQVGIITCTVIPGHG
jgi:hypothetical protein